MSISFQAHQRAGAELSILILLRMIQLRDASAPRSLPALPSFIRKIISDADFQSEFVPVAESLTETLERLEAADLDDRAALTGVTRDFVAAFEPWMARFGELFTEHPAEMQGAFEGYAEVQLSLVHAFLGEGSGAEAFDRALADFSALSTWGVEKFTEDSEEGREAILAKVGTDPDMRRRLAEDPLMQVHLLLTGIGWLAMKGRSADKARDMSHMAYLTMRELRELFRFGGVELSPRLPEQAGEARVEHLLARVERLRASLSDEDLEGVLANRVESLR